MVRYFGRGRWMCAAITLVVGIAPELYLAFARRALAGWLFRGSPIWTAYLRLNGARIGRGVSATVGTRYFDGIGTPPFPTAGHGIVDCRRSTSSFANSSGSRERGCFADFDVVRDDMGARFERLGDYVLTWARSEKAKPALQSVRFPFYAKSKGKKKPAAVVEEDDEDLELDDDSE